MNFANKVSQARLLVGQAQRVYYNSVAAKASQSYNVVVLPGDGIGPEITKVTLELLKLAGQKEDVSFSFEEHLIGGAAIDKTGVPLPDETLEASKKSDAILLAAIGG